MKECRQEAQLLVGDRATRKPAKDCWKFWNGRGNDNLGWNDLQMYFKVINIGTNRKLVYDFLLVVYSNFSRRPITHRFWEIWCETVQWPWNWRPLSSEPPRISAYLILPETTFLGLQFCRWQYMGSSANFRTVVLCPKAGDANPLVAEPETDFNTKWPFKVIYFGIIEEPLRGYIAQ